VVRRACIVEIVVGITAVRRECGQGKCHWAKHQESPDS
jgi:hypothetical protein